MRGRGSSKVRHGQAGSQQGSIMSGTFLRLHNISGDEVVAALLMQAPDLEKQFGLFARTYYRQGG